MAPQRLRLSLFEAVHPHYPIDFHVALQSGYMTQAFLNMNDLFCYVVQAERYSHSAEYVVVEHVLLHVLPVVVLSAAGILSVLICSRKCTV